MHWSKAPFCAILATSSLGLCAPALAQTSTTAKAAAPSPAPPAAALDIKGFRSAIFGMTQAQVRAAVAADFGAATKIEQGANPTDGTEYLTRSTYGNAGDTLNLDIDPKTHPAWTGGSQQLLDRGGRLSKFSARFGSIGARK